MKIDPKILEGGELEPQWSDTFGDPNGDPDTQTRLERERAESPLADLSLKMKFPRVSERRNALLDEKGNPRDESAIREFYLSRIVGWNVTDEAGEPLEFTRSGLDQLLELESGLEGWIISEVQDLSRFL